MNYEAWKFWIDIVEVVLVAGVYFYVWFVNMNKATNERIDGVEEATDERLDNHESRIATLEGQMGALPTHHDMDDIKRQFASLGRETSEQTGMLKALTTQVGLIQEWLYGKAK